MIGGSLYEIGGYTLPLLATGVLVAIDAGLRVLLLPARSRSAGGEPDICALLFDRSVLVAAAAVALAAIGLGIIEPLPPVHLARAGVNPACSA